MKTIKQFIIPSLFLLFTATSCFYLDDFSIRGNGILETENRYASSFSKIKSSGSFEVTVEYSDRFEVSVTAESNILPYIDINVDGNTLEIDIEGIHSLRNTRPMEVHVKTPVLEGLKISGSGSIETGHFECSNFESTISGSGTVDANITCRRMEAFVSGSGEIRLKGEAEYSKFVISGSGKVDAYDFISTDCETNVSGSGDIFTTVDRQLDVTISGSGNVFYSGHPQIKSRITGSGKIINDN
jgi:hypothetical protein